MAGTSAQREATLKAKEAALAAAIAAQQKALRLNRHVQRKLEAAAHREQCSLIGQLVYDLGLGEMPREELRRALMQVAAFATEPVPFHHFCNGDITREWIGKERIAAVVDYERKDVYAQGAVVGVGDRQRGRVGGDVCAGPAVPLGPVGDVD